MVKIGTILLIADSILGLYLINSGMNFISFQLPESVQKWIIVTAGILLIVGGIMSMTGNSNRHFRH